MKSIDPELLKIDESRSNPMAVALQNPECPINEICFYMVVGFGGVLKQCEHIKIDANDAEGRAYCVYQPKEV